MYGCTASKKNQSENKLYAILEKLKESHKRYKAQFPTKVDFEINFE